MATTKTGKPTSYPIADLIEQYLEDCKRGGNGHRKLSTKTVKWSYGFPLRGVFLKWADQERITSSTQLDQRAIDRFAEDLKNRTSARGKPLAVDSVATYAATVQHFANWCARQGYIEAIQGRKGLVAAAQVTVEQPKRKDIDVLTREEIATLERAARDERDKLIIRTLADTGIRVGELVHLQVTDLRDHRLKGHYLHVHGKTGDRMVPIKDASVWRRLTRYRDELRPRKTSTTALFLTRRRRDATGEYDGITESGVGQMVSLAGADAGIEKRVYPHILRHTAATWMLTSGMNPIEVANVLGHSSLAMIYRVYSHLTPANLYQAMVEKLID
jgi:integrase/recombinase XerD